MADSLTYKKEFERNNYIGFNLGNNNSINSLIYVPELMLNINVSNGVYTSLTNIQIPILNKDKKNISTTIEEKNYITAPPSTNMISNISINKGERVELYFIGNCFKYPQYKYSKDEDYEMKKTFIKNGNMNVLLDKEKNIIYIDNNGNAIEITENKVYIQGIDIIGKIKELEERLENIHD